MSDLFEGSPNLAHKPCPFGLSSLRDEAQLMFRSSRSKPDVVQTLSEINRLTLDRERLYARKKSYPIGSEKALALQGQIRFLTNELLKFEGKV